jgi:hypothetical protein
MGMMVAGTKFRSRVPTTQLPSPTFKERLPMNSHFSVASQKTFLFLSVVTLLCSIPLFLISKSALIFLSTAAILITAACLIFFADIFDLKIKRTYYPIIAAAYFIEVTPILNAFGIYGGYQSEHLSIPQTIEWYANPWIQMLLTVMIFVTVHSMVKWFNRRNHC